MGVIPHDVLINSIFSSAYTKLESKLWKETSACRNTQEPVEKNIIETSRCLPTRDFAKENAKTYGKTLKQMIFDIKSVFENLATAAAAALVSMRYHKAKMVGNMYCVL